MMMFTVPLGTHVAFTLLLIVLLTCGILGKSFNSPITSPKGSAGKTSIFANTEDAPIQLYSDSSSLYIKHRTFPKLGEVELSVRNGTLQIATLPTGGASKLALATSRRYYAIFGFYKLKDIHYIALVKSVSPLPDYKPEKSSILKVNQIELIALPNQTVSADTDLIMRKLTRKLNSFSFLYSVGEYDILRTLQANQDHAAPHSSSVDRFYWNKNIIKTLALNDDNNYLCTKFVNALVSASSFKLGHEMFSLVLIARRSRKQQGQRYIKRGVDKHGEVANYVEIEQILLLKGKGGISSFVQVRGSIPLYWSQPTPWKPKPDIIIVPDENSTSMQSNQSLVVQRHIRHLVRDYGLSIDADKAGFILVNLVDKNGGQGRLGRLWYDMLKSLHGSSLVENQHDITDRSLITVQDFLIPLAVKVEEKVRCKYVWMDYHFQCQNQGTHEVIKKLKAQLQPLMQSNSLLYSSNTKVSTMQRCLVRTNCVDCLDRTNVVQTALSRWALREQIQALSPSSRTLFRSSDGDMSLPTQTLESDFRKMWTRLGDELSILYAGSKAMKRDVTMNGVRTKSGVLQDAMSYLQRYYINNYRDKANQQDLNIILGVEGEVEDELVEDLATVPTAETKVSEESNTGEEDTDEEDKEDEEEDAYDDIDSVEVSDKKFSAVIADTGSEDASDSDTDISTAESSNADEVEDESPKSRFGRMLNSFFSSLQTDLHDALENAAQSDI